MSTTENEVKKPRYECRFATYCPPPERGMPDLHVIKEIVHHPDGTQSTNLRQVRDYKSPFWITKEGHRNHKEKKEWEHLDKLSRYETTRSDQSFNVARALGTPWARGSLRDLCGGELGQYVYGADILSTAVIKRSYQDRFPEVNTPYTSAMFDTETDVLHGTNEIQMATLSSKSKVVTVIKNSFVAGHSNVEDKLRAMLQKYLGSMKMKNKKTKEMDVVDILAQRGIQWEVVFVEREVDIVLEIFKRAHEWKPDFLAIWNIDFDIQKVMRALEKAQIDPATVISDPSVPPEYKFFRYKQGPSVKVTDSGKRMPIKMAARWHTVYCPASFYFIDAMCAYKHIRTGSPEEPSYGLDAILKKHQLGGKLSFEQADHLSGIDWHLYMQEKYPLEYVIYNVWDCVSMEMLDEETTDLSLTLPLFSGCSDFATFKSQPRRTADNLHYFSLKQGRAIGTTSNEMKTDLDKLTIGVDDWIVTLPAHLVTDSGLQVVKQAPFMRTNIRGHVGDLDVSASYPNGGCVFNISRETTFKEIVKIVGVSEEQQRMQGINLSGGHTNAVEWCTSLLGLPQMDTMLNTYRRSKEAVTIDV
ncbi:hypothetical protein D3C71_79340 [compost metagenome]